MGFGLLASMGKTLDDSREVCVYIFDSDRTGVLSRNEFEAMVRATIGIKLEYLLKTKWAGASTHTYKRCTCTCAGAQVCMCMCAGRARAHSFAVPLRLRALVHPESRVALPSSELCYLVALTGRAPRRSRRQ